MPKRKMVKHNYASHKHAMSRGHGASRSTYMGGSSARVPAFKKHGGKYATKRMGNKPRMNPYH